MFRPTFFKIRYTINQTIIKSGFSSSADQYKAKTDQNRVKLVGTLTVDSFQFKKSGLSSLSIKTFNSPDGNAYTIHNVHTLGYENLTAGQRIQVNGTLRCDPFKTENGKVRERLYIRANRITLLEDQKNTPVIDCNNIDIIGNVADRVIEIDHFSIIKFATHSNREVDNENKTLTSFLSVFLYDKRLREYARSLKVSDRISIDGALGHKVNSFSNGKLIHSGFILPKTIEKVIWNRHKRDAEMLVKDLEF